MPMSSAHGAKAWRRNATARCAACPSSPPLLPAGIRRNMRGIALIGFEHHMTERMIRQLKDVVRDAVQGVADLLN